jgi:hypothetical protein
VTTTVEIAVVVVVEMRGLGESVIITVFATVSGGKKRGTVTVDASAVVVLVTTIVSSTTTVLVEGIHVPFVLVVSRLGRGKVMASTVENEEEASATVPRAKKGIGSRIENDDDGSQGKIETTV